MRSIASMTVLTVAGALALAGCGGGSSSDSGSGGSGASGGSSSSSGSSGGSRKLTLAADPGGQWKFDKSQLQAKAGKVTIAFTNSSSTEHGLEVEGHGVEKETGDFTGGTKSLTVNLKPGTYEFYCPVPGHREAGMKGTLVVN